MGTDFKCSSLTAKFATEWVETQPQIQLRPPKLSSVLSLFKFPRRGDENTEFQTVFVRNVYKKKLFWSCIARIFIWAPLNFQKKGTPIFEHIRACYFSWHVWNTRKSNWKNSALQIVLWGLVVFCHTVSQLANQSQRLKKKMTWPGDADMCAQQRSTTPPETEGEPQKKLLLSIVSGLFHRDPDNGLLQSPHNWEISHPPYTLNNKGPFFHCSGGYPQDISVPGDSSRDLCIPQWEVTNILWLRVTYPSQKGHQQNCQVC